ncbi:MAG: Mur ligase family protein [Prevotella sp.]|nr:Mur ligase family protein [Bacteroides sp.]MCM1365975.1 Mur ligase family protein [Prevotella sp.]MCM1436604.1 Mur ligase family protein [Prevotella sp.]
MDYKESIEYLYSQLPMFSRVGAAAYKPGLQTSEHLDEFFGHPHKKFKSIHIGGTNGKGSTSHLLAAVLQSQGYKTGLYTSPHLVDFRERMKINGEMIPEVAVVDFVERFRKSGYDGHPSFFELTMMMAFDWFAREQVDYAVIEVGMGGRLDSTNIISPIGCVITNISSDHTQFLGDTLTAIASEKAGIIKSGIPVTIGEAEGEIEDVFRKRIASVGTKSFFAQQNPCISELTVNPEGGIEGLSEDYGRFSTGLSGEYQVKNLNTVFTAIRMLREAGVYISAESVKTGVKDVERLTGFRGRWTRLSNRPLVICDTGHNEGGLKYNFRQLERIMQGRPEGSKLHIVVGFVADKAIDKILRMFPREAVYYFTQAQIPRALDVDILEQKGRENGYSGHKYRTVESAYRGAMQNAGEDDIVYVGGSTFVVADLLAAIE